jgi:hypothetical protein
VRKPKPKTKTACLGIRLPPKLKFGLDIVCKKRGLTASEATMRAIELLLKAEGVDDGLFPSRLDRLWMENMASQFGHEPDDAQTVNQ